MKSLLSSLFATAGFLTAVPLASAGSPAAAAAATAPGTRPVVEWAPFRLAPGVDEATLLSASAILQREFLAGQPGFIRRELLKTGDGQWVDVVLWADQASADAAIARAATSTACAAYFTLMAGADHAEPGAGVSHFEQVAVYTDR